MKKFILIALTFCFLTTLKSQTINDIPISEIDVDYILIKGNQKMFSTKMMIQFDFGQHDKVFSAKDNIMKDKDGNFVSFNSMIEALNFMSGNGYEFVSAYTVGDGKVVTHVYILKRKEG